MELKPIRSNDQPFGRGAPAYEPAQEAVDVSQGQKVLRNTYMLLAATMVPTVIGAFVGMQFAGVMTARRRWHDASAATGAWHTPSERGHLRAIVNGGIIAVFMAPHASACRR